MPLSLRTVRTSIGSATPLRTWVPSERVSKKPRVSWWVAGLIVIVFRSARPWRRAAMLGVSPSARFSRFVPPPTSPTTTRPVWMPMRTASSSGAFARASARRLPIASRIPIPARTARSASSSWADG